MIKDDGLRLRPRVDASLGLGSERLGIYGVGSLGRDFVYGNQRITGNNRHSYGAGVTVSLSRCALNAGASASRSLAFQSELVAFGELEQAVALFGAGVQCRITSALGFNASVSKTDSSLARGATDAFNSDSMAYSAGVQFSRPALGIITLNGSITDVALPGRQVLTPDGFVDDGVQQRSARLGISRAFGSRINVSLSASLLNTQPVAPFDVVIVDGILQLVDREGFSGAGYDARIDLRPSRKLTLGVGANRGLRFNNFAGSRMILADTLQANLSYQLGRSLRLAASFQQQRNSFRGGALTALEPARRNGDTFRFYSARMTTTLGRLLNLSLEVRHNTRTSDPAIFNFESTGVGLVLGFRLGKRGGA